MWCSASAVLIIEAEPEAGRQWLIIDLTEPRAMPGTLPLRGPNTVVSDWISVRSPTAVPVPWASIRPMLAGSMPLLS